MVERDYEDIRNTDQLSDNELRAMVRDAFEQQLAVDPDDVTIRSAIRSSSSVPTRSSGSRNGS